MSDEEDPYAVSSDSEDESNRKGPPPKIEFEGRADLKQIKEALTGDENKQVKDEKTLEEIEELRKSKGQELSQLKKEFEEGRAGQTSNGNAEENGNGGQQAKEDVQGLDRQTLSQFKDKFENMPDTLKQNMEEKMGQKDDLLNELQQRSANQRQLKGVFEQKEEEEPKNCCICEKVVYPVEKVWAGKHLYHSQCFKCSKCGKKLSQNAFNSHKGILYCKPHMLEVLHPERAGQFAAEELEEGGQPIEVEDEEDEFAVSSRPKQLAADVVRAGGANIGDELAQLRSLKEKKDNWQSSVAEAQQMGDRHSAALSPEELAAAGTVKGNLEKFISGGADSTAQLDDEEKRRQLEEIKSQVSEVKQKWRTGDVESAGVQQDDAVKREELEALKGVNVKQRFQPPSGNGEVQKSYDRSELENSGAADARKSFLEGSAFTSAKTESAAAGELNELKFTEMNAYKDKFEKGQMDVEEIEKAKVELDLHLKELKKTFEKPESEMSPEERAEKKKAEIEAEFARYKLARKLQSKKAREQAEEEGAGASAETVGDGEKELDVQIKLAGKARQKFKEIEAQGAAGTPQPGAGQTAKGPSKWDKKTAEGPAAEVVNRRAVDEDSGDEEEEFDVKNLMQKFKNISDTPGTKGRERSLEELEALRMEAKNLRQQFEQANQLESAEVGEEKRRQLEEEFKQLKGERERARKELEAEQAEAVTAIGAEKEDIQVAADHASKMAAKWEKIHKKEAKKAEKSKMPQK